MGMKSPAKKKEIVKRSRPTDAELGKIDSNNGDAGKIISDLTAGHKSIEYEARDIALYDIRVNADNEIFRQADTKEDIVQLAEDIQRNGLMHNLVVFPQEENGKTVYVLLSGERRYRAMEYLEKRGDATWNTIKNCNVITTGVRALQEADGRGLQDARPHGHDHAEEGAHPLRFPAEHPARRKRRARVPAVLLRARPDLLRA